MKFEESKIKRGIKRRKKNQFWGFLLFYMWCLRCRCVLGSTRNCRGFPRWNAVKPCRWKHQWHRLKKKIPRHSRLKHSWKRWDTCVPHVNAEENGFFSFFWVFFPALGKQSFTFCHWVSMWSLKLNIIVMLNLFGRKNIWVRFLFKAIKHCRKHLRLIPRFIPTKQRVSFNTY